jgi:hypothetical protein
MTAISEGRLGTHAVYGRPTHGSCGGQQDLCGRQSDSRNRYRFGDPARYAQGDPPSILSDWTQSTTGHKQIGGAHDVQWIDEGLPGAGDFLIFNNAQFAQGGGGRRQGGPQRSSNRQGPESGFHTNVPNRLLDITLARPTDQSVTVVVTSHEDLEVSVEYGTTRGEYCASTPP